MAKFAGLVKDLTADLTADVLKLTTDLANLASFNEKLRRRVSTLEGKAADAEEGLATMKATIKGLETRVANEEDDDTAHTWYKENKGRLDVLEKNCCDSQRLDVTSLRLQRSD